MEILKVIVQIFGLPVVLGQVDIDSLARIKPLALFALLVIWEYYQIKEKLLSLEKG